MLPATSTLTKKRHPSEGWDLLNYAVSYRSTGPGLRRGDVPLPVWRNVVTSMLGWVGGAKKGLIVSTLKRVNKSCGPPCVRPKCIRILSNQSGISPFFRRKKKSPASTMQGIYFGGERDRVTRVFFCLMISLY